MMHDAESVGLFQRSLLTYVGLFCWSHFISKVSFVVLEGERRRAERTIQKAESVHLSITGLF